jgi:hypothetical protein
MLMEHVKNPRPFMEAVARCLKPGGSYIFGTINGAHYFAKIAGSLRRLKLDELILRLLHGKSGVESYHYPVFYRVNTTRVIENLAAELGFEKPQYIFMEQTGPDPYFPGPMRPILRALQWKRDVLRDPTKLLVLICKLTKAATPQDAGTRASVPHTSARRHKSARSTAGGSR